jgi:hypothetical protein
MADDTIRPGVDESMALADAEIECEEALHSVVTVHSQNGSKTDERYSCHFEWCEV